MSIMQDNKIDPQELKKYELRGNIYSMYRVWNIWGGSRIAE